MSDIFEEVDQALQQEKIEKFWHDHKEKIIAGLVAILLVTGAYTGITNWNEKRNGEETARLINALSEKNDEAVAKIAQDSRQGIETVARFSKAGKALQEEKPEIAQEQYAAIIENGASRSMEDLARILLAQNQGEDTLQSLKPVLADKKSPWHWHALIQAANIEAEKNNDYAKAIDYLDRFEEAQDNVSATLKQRAAAMRHVYMLKQNQQQEDNKS